MSLKDLLDKGTAAVDAGDERVLAQAILDLNAKLDALAAKVGTVGADTGFPRTWNISGGTIQLDAPVGDGTPIIPPTGDDGDKDDGG